MLKKRPLVKTTENERQNPRKVQFSGRSDMQSAHACAVQTHFLHFCALAQSSHQMTSKSSPKWTQIRRKAMPGPLGTGFCGVRKIGEKRKRPARLGSAHSGSRSPASTPPQVAPIQFSESRRGHWETEVPDFRISGSPNLRICGSQILRLRFSTG